MNSNEKEKKKDPPPTIFPEVSDDPKAYGISLYRTLDEETASEIIQALLIFNECDHAAAPEDPDNSKSPVKEVTYKPINFYISTWGGDAREMFAIYDIMRAVRKENNIVTYGIGKVMSAGVLLLAAGTKGQRKIGKNCRVMIHSVSGDQVGALHNLENEMEEIRWIQNQHIEALVEETSMTKKQLKSLLNRKVNVYLDATEAVKYGIADIII